MGKNNQSKIKRMKTPKEFLKLSEDDSWIPCMMCGGEVIQIRKARFSCLKCNIEFIADEKDMR